MMYLLYLYLQKNGAMLLMNAITAMLSAITDVLGQLGPVIVVCIGIVCLLASAGIRIPAPRTGTATPIIMLLLTTLIGILGRIFTALFWRIPGRVFRESATAFGATGPVWSRLLAVLVTIVYLVIII